MSAGETFAVTAAMVTTIVGALTIWKAFLPWSRGRRSRTSGLNNLLHGKPDETDAQGKVIEPGYPAIGVQLRELREVVSTGLNDRVTDLHQGQTEMRSALDQMATKASDAARLAGQAAATSARVEQQHTEDISRIGGKVEQIDGKVEELREVFKERLEAAEYNAEAWKSVATELGMPWPDERTND